MESFDESVPGDAGDSVEAYVNYRAVQKKILANADKDWHRLEFDFAKYMRKSLSHMLVEQLETPISSWLVVMMWLAVQLLITYIVYGHVTMTCGGTMIHLNFVMAVLIFISSWILLAYGRYITKQLYDRVRYEIPKLKLMSNKEKRKAQCRHDSGARATSHSDRKTQRHAIAIQKGNAQKKKRLVRVTLYNIHV